MSVTMTIRSVRVVLVTNVKFFRLWMDFPAGKIGMFTLLAPLLVLLNAAGASPKYSVNQEVSHFIL